MIYFNANTITDKAQNATTSGFNDWSCNYNPDANGDNKLSSLGISSATSWDYADLVTQIAALPELTVTLTDDVYTDVLFSLQTAGILSETTRVDLVRTCENILRNGVYIKWINSNGGYDYEFFKDKIEQSIDSRNIVTAQNAISILNTANKKCYNINGEAYKQYKVIKMNIPKEYYIDGKLINNVDRYNDLKAASLVNNIFVYNRKYFGDVAITDYSGTKAGTVKCESNNHGQITGDEVAILTGTYAGTYTIFKIDNHNFYIIATYSADSTTYFNRIVQKQDWQLCEVKGFNDFETMINTTLSISFNIEMPSFGV